MNTLIALYLINLLIILLMLIFKGGKDSRFTKLCTELGFVHVFAIIVFIIINLINQPSLLTL